MELNIVYYQLSSSIIDVRGRGGLRVGMLTRKNAIQLLEERKTPSYFSIEFWSWNSFYGSESTLFERVSQIHSTDMRIQ